jgi:hypothetical protein
MHLKRGLPVGLPIPAVLSNSEVRAQVSVKLVESGKSSLPSFLPSPSSLTDETCPS